jgi:hypothetical protein
LKGFILVIVRLFGRSIESLLRALNS